jgi:organic hydroperoxide reductase OsmC/OhrA
MKIMARVRNAGASHQASVATAGVSQDVPLPAKAAGSGSAINGGELLMLALATCYCNDLYREAAHLNILLDAVEVDAQAEFEGVGLAASSITYRARIVSSADDAAIEDLLKRTDAVAEVHNTRRSGAAVTRRPWGE